MNQNIKHVKKIINQKPLIWCLGILQLPKRSHFNKHISYLLETNILSLCPRITKSLLTFEIDSHTRCNRQRVFKGYHAGGWICWKIHGRLGTRSGFTPWPRNTTMMLIQPAHHLQDLCVLNIISSSQAHSKHKDKNQITKYKKTNYKFSQY